MASTSDPVPPIDLHASVAPISGEAETPRPVDPALEPEVPGLLSDCRLMLSYSRKNAFVVPPALLHEIAWLDSLLKSKGISPISSITSRLVSTIDTTKGEPRYVAASALSPAMEPPLPEAPPAGLSAEEVILDVHSQLSTLISPTTALSLQTSEPPSGKTHVLGGMPPLIRTVIAVAVCSALVFVATALGIARNAAKAAAAEKAKAVAVAAAASAAAASAAAAPRLAPPPAEAVSSAPAAASGGKP